MKFSHEQLVLKLLTRKLHFSIENCTHVQLITCDAFVLKISF